MHVVAGDGPPLYGPLERRAFSERTLLPKCDCSVALARHGRGNRQGRGNTAGRSLQASGVLRWLDYQNFAFGIRNALAGVMENSSSLAFIAARFSHEQEVTLSHKLPEWPHGK